MANHEAADTGAVELFLVEAKAGCCVEVVKQHAGTVAPVGEDAVAACAAHFGVDSALNVICKECIGIHLELFGTAAAGTANTALNVTSGSGVELIGSCKRRTVACVVLGNFDSACNYEALFALAEVLCCISGAFCENFTNAFALADFFGDLDDSICIAPAKFDTVEFFLGEDSLIVAFHCPCNGAADRNSVISILIAEGIADIDAHCIAVEKQRTEFARGLVLGTASVFFGIAFTGEVIDSAAADGAHVACVLSLLEALIHLLSAGLGFNGIGAIYIAAEPVLNTDISGIDGGFVGTVGTLIAEHIANGLNRAVHLPINGLFVECENTCLVGGSGLIAAAYYNSLEILGAHNGTAAAATCSSVAIVHYGCHAMHLFAGNADGSCSELEAKLLFEGVFKLNSGGSAPIFFGRANFNLAIIDEDVNGLFGLALYENCVIAGFAKLGAKSTAGVGIVPAVGNGGLADNGVTAGHQSAGAVKCAADKANHAVFVKNRGVGRHLFIENLCAKSSAAGESANSFLGEGAYFGFAGAEIYKKDFTYIGIHYNYS